jgi:hypothetical protein
MRTSTLATHTAPHHTQCAGAAKVWTLTAANGDDANSPGDPTHISPTMQEVSGFGSGSLLEVPALSFTVVQVQLV